MPVFLSVDTQIPSQHILLSQVMVHITDENDCSPEFQHSIYSRDNIPETIPVGTSLLQGEDHPGIFCCSLAMDLTVCVTCSCSYREEVPALPQRALPLSGVDGSFPGGL